MLSKSNSKSLGNHVGLVSAEEEKKAAVGIKDLQKRKILSLRESG